MKNFYQKVLFSIVFLTLLGACKPKQTFVAPHVKTGAKDDGKIEIIILQANDVYEIAPTEGGKVGGMARVASLKRKLRVENRNTLFVLAGDFVSPSLIGTLKINGKRIAGKQMVETMNAAGVDLVTFGNHEFDLDRADLQARIDESNFDWICNNLYFTETPVANQPESGVFEGIIAPPSKLGNQIAPHKVSVFQDDDGTTLKLGMFGTVLDAQKKDYIFYKSIFDESKNSVSQLKKLGADVIIGVTHVNLEDDKNIAAQNPDIQLIMGGHEHNNMRHTVGNTIITKADANAKTVWVHRIKVDKILKKTEIKSELISIDDTFFDDPDVEPVVSKWIQIADSTMRASGFEPYEVVLETKESLDGRETTNRLQQTNMGKMIAQSMALVAEKPADCAFFNSGAVRIDDNVTGKITQMDIIRILPFGGSLIEMDIKGEELQKVLMAGIKNKGRGGYLQWHNIEYIEEKNIFKINQKTLDLQKSYHIIVNDFTFSGKEANLDFFTEKNPFITNVSKAKDMKDLRSDMRRAFIHLLKQ